jgi:hypothetical protein
LKASKDQNDVDAFLAEVSGGLILMVHLKPYQRSKNIFSLTMPTNAEPAH